MICWETLVKVRSPRMAHNDQKSALKKKIDLLISKHSDTFMKLICWYSQMLSLFIERITGSPTGEICELCAMLLSSGL